MLIFIVLKFSFYKYFNFSSLSVLACYTTKMGIGYSFIYYAFPSRSGYTTKTIILVVLGLYMYKLVCIREGIMGFLRL